MRKNQSIVRIIVSLGLVSLVAATLVCWGVPSWATETLTGLNLRVNLLPLVYQSCEPDYPVCDFVSNLPAVVEEHDPIELSRPITTDEASILFQYLYDRGYFTERFQGSGNAYLYFLDYYFERFQSSEKVNYYSRYYDVSHIDDLAEALEAVDRRAFLEAVAHYVSPDRSVDELEDFVREAMIHQYQDVTWHDPDHTQMVTDPAILLFSGLGKCGQTNRLLVDLLQFGAGYEARGVEIVGHFFAEVKDGPNWRMIDGNVPVSGVRLLPVSFEEYLRDYKVNSVLMDSIPLLPGIIIAHSTMYQSTEAGESWYRYYTRTIADGGYGSEAITESYSDKYYYNSEGYVYLLDYQSWGEEYRLESEGRRVRIQLREWPYKRPRSISLLVLTDDPNGLFIPEWSGDELNAIHRQEFLPYLVYEYFQIVNDMTEVVVDLPQDISAGEYWLCLFVYPGNSNRLSPFYVGDWQVVLP
jgi:hypothetical protein